MKRIKYFVLSFLMIFSFGCIIQKQTAESNLKLLLSNIDDVEKYTCVREGMQSTFVCVLETELNETKLVTCYNDGCVFINCGNDNFCFQSNDTE